MNSKVLIGLVAVVVVGSVFFASSKKSEDNMVKNDLSMNQKADEMIKKDLGEGAMMEEKRMDAKMEVKMNEKKDEGESMDQKVGDSMMTAGSYEVYSVEKLAKAETGKVVLFLRASWCPSCKTLDADIKSNLTNIPKSLTILDVNYDTHADLKQKYGVTYQHTLVQVDKDGNMINKWSGGATLSTVVTNLK